MCRPAASASFLTSSADAGAISLGVGEPDFVTPWPIRDAAIQAIEEGRTQYTSNWGLESLREKVAAYLRMRYHAVYDPKDEVLITVGASEGLDLPLRALVCPGTRCSWPNHASQLCSRA